MPTPRDSTEERLSPLEPHPHISCPPESIDHPAQWSQQVLGDIESATVDATTSGDSAPDRDPIDGLPPSAFDSCADGLETTRPSNRPISRSTVDSTFSPLARSPCDISHEEQETAKVQAINEAPSALKLSYSDRYGIVSPRLIHTHTSCKLRNGSRYQGTQTSDQQQYNVEVIIKTIDMSESFICGYLKIEGLTPEHATLTTFFEGEIIGSKYTFQTRHDSWGASERDDMKHWGHFPAWKPLAKQARKADFQYKHMENRENIFMRWKEKFLVPDHRVKEISGASFEGFYYICFNQIAGSISGIYYHSKSDSHHNSKIQNLELEWLPDKGRFAAMEFR